MPLRLGMAALLLLALAACGGNRNQRHSGIPGPGFVETQLESNEFRVTYSDARIEFAKKAAYYRLAELGIAKGFSFFRVKEERITHEFVPKSFSRLDMDRDSGRVYDDSRQGWTGLEGAENGYSYHAEFFKDDPQRSGSVDANAFLSSHPRPDPDETR